jgi:hypothetical protein
MYVYVAYIVLYDKCTVGLAFPAFCETERFNITFIKGINVTGLYCVPCECSMVYVGQTGRTTEAGCKEHTRYIRLGQLVLSAVA